MVLIHSGLQRRICASLSLWRAPRVGQGGFRPLWPLGGVSVGSGAMPGARRCGTPGWKGREGAEMTGASPQMGALSLSAPHPRPVWLLACGLDCFVALGGFGAGFWLCNEEKSLSAWEGSMMKPSCLVTRSYVCAWSGRTTPAARAWALSASLACLELGLEG